MDINREAEKLLSKLPYNLSYFYPDSFNDFPLVSFYDISTKSSFDTDNKKACIRGYIQVDIWSTEPSQTAKIAEETEELAEADGWWCELNMSIDKTDGVYHRTMRLGKEFETN